MYRILLAALLVGSIAAAAADHGYVGTKKCAMCHKGPKHNEVFETWKEAKHAKAFEVLADPRAAEVAAEMGVEGAPQESGECLRCHTTGYGKGDLALKMLPADGVSCEACHGAGKDYAKKPIMKDLEKSVAKGLVEDPSTICVNCHDEKLAHVKEFVYEERWERISHSLPDEAKE